MVPASSRIESWPTLLTLELACRYLSLESVRFLALAERNRVLPVEVDDAGVLWRRRDLDRLVNRLPTASENLGEDARSRPTSLDQATVDRIAVAIAERLGQSGGGPELLSIKDAGRQLGLGRTTVYKMIDEGSLRVRRLGRRTLITRESIASLIAPGSR